MPTYRQAVTAMQDYFNTSWNDDTPVLFDDDAQDVPEETFVRFNVQHNEGFQSTMGAPGNNRFQRRGLVIVQIFQKQGDFAIDAREKAENALALFAGVTNSDIYYYDGYIREVGNDGRGWYQINVVTSFRYDEIT